MLAMISREVKTLVDGGKYTCYIRKIIPKFGLGNTLPKSRRTDASML